MDAAGQASLPDLERGVNDSSPSAGNGSSDEPAGQARHSAGRYSGTAHNDSENNLVHQHATGGSSRRRRLPFNLAVPPLVRQACKSVADWAKGPSPPQTHKIRAVWPRLQTAPLRLLDRLLPKPAQRLVLLLAFYFCWLLVFVTVLHRSAFTVLVDGQARQPIQISCIDSFWSSGNGCGLDGNQCRPFNQSSMPFRCPANCANARLLNPHAVGAQELNYQSLVVGGPTAENDDAPYRGDSFICAAAIHAGAITNAQGGCGVVRLVGERRSYTGSTRHGIHGVGFDSSFPRSFAFERHGSRGDAQPSNCRDPRWVLLAISVIFTSLASLFTTSPAVFFGTVFVGIFWQVGLASDPPRAGDYYTLVSILLSRFLPAAFIAYVVYLMSVRRALRGLRAQVEKTVLWLGGCWVGALTNHTFAFIPISRLTPRDLQQQPGAKAALALVVTLLVLIALLQAWHIRLEGRLPRYLALYAALCSCLVLFVAVPGLNLRIHHYILALLLLPGTAMQTRPSLLFQGLLFGLFINGVARWGFASILQTPAALLGDGQLFSPLPAIAAPQLAPDSANVTFTWTLSSIMAATAAATASDISGSSSYANGSVFDGVSILVNDVERYRGYADHDPLRFTWTRPTAPPALPYYFRFAFTQGSSVGDYTKAGIWHANGSWTHMPPGPS